MSIVSPVKNRQLSSTGNCCWGSILNVESFSSKSWTFIWSIWVFESSLLPLKQTVDLHRELDKFFEIFSRFVILKLIVKLFDNFDKSLSFNIEKFFAIKSTMLMRNMIVKVWTSSAPPWLSNQFIRVREEFL